MFILRFDISDKCLFKSSLLIKLCVVKNEKNTPKYCIYFSLRYPLFEGQFLEKSTVMSMAIDLSIRIILLIIISIY